MNNFKKYSSYKDSEIDSIVFVPAHWLPLKINHFTQVVSQKSKPNEELLSVYRDFGVIPKNSRTDNHNKDGEDLTTYKLVEPGYLVLNKMKTWQGSLGVSNFRGIVSPAYITCKVKGDFFDNNYPHYLLRSEKYIFQYNRISYGVRVDQWDMRYDDFKNLIVYAPPLPEQTAIANFLDKKTAEIKEFIALKEKTIALLKERKMAIINQAVTKGLDLTVEMRDSGIEWLGKIPKHWVFTKISSVSKKVSRKGIKNPILLSVEREKGVILRSESEGNHNVIPDDLSSYKLVNPGDLVINKMKTWQGSLGISSHTGVVSPAYIILEIEASFEIKYLHHLLRCRSYINEYNRISYGVRPDQWDMHFEDFKQLPILLPTLAEQIQIVEHIEQKFQDIEITISEIRKEIDIIKEYQQSLISEVVTGKVDISEEISNK